MAKGIPQVELKPLPAKLRYAYLGPNFAYPDIHDLKGINLFIYMSYNDHKLFIENKWKLNPNMKEVVQKEVIKLLDARVIYLIYGNN